ncbi:hypothetical protein [Mesorhizobium sp.]|uniref:hypothetical protein n=1 Tax=Mesorhizobium sp. TaxID=1871066 RepID=UPI0025DE2EA0|nr:hypothetical protein [Mesorhizobium sp.]
MPDLSASSPREKPLEQLKESARRFSDPDLRKNKRLERFGDFTKRRTALSLGPGRDSMAKNGKVT